MIVDTQFHEIGPTIAWPPSERNDVMCEVALSWMDAVGVDIAVLNPLDDDWGHFAVDLAPKRFVSVPIIRSPNTQAGITRLTSEVDRTGVVGARIMLGSSVADPDGTRGRGWLVDGALDEFMCICDNRQLPLFVLASNALDIVERLAVRWPGLTIIVDHLGLTQPPLSVLPVDPDSVLRQVAALATFPNVYLKVCGSNVLSAMLYPHRDLQSRLSGLFDAFGVDRMMWASDIARFVGRMGWSNGFEPAQQAYKGRHTYAESLGLFLWCDWLSEEDKSALLGRTAARVLGL